jgi:hypothetical protein
MTHQQPRENNRWHCHSALKKDSAQLLYASGDPLLGGIFAQSKHQSNFAKSFVLEKVQQ